VSAIDRIEFCGVEGLRVGRFNLGLTTTCIVYRIGNTLIDAGPPNQWRVVREFVKEREVGRLLITHHHEDHSGNAARIQQQTEARLLMHHDGVDRLAHGFPLRLYQRVFWGRPEHCTPEAVEGQIEPAGGTRLQLIHTPGHSADSTCYLAPDEGWLFTGDLYIARKTRYLRQDENLKEYIRSLRQVLESDFDTVFCAHRGVVPSGRQALRDKLDYLVELRARVRRLHAEGRSVAEITRMLFGREDFLSWTTWFHFSKKNLIAGCLEE